MIYTILFDYILTALFAKTTNIINILFNLISIILFSLLKLIISFFFPYKIEFIKD